MQEGLPRGKSKEKNLILKVIAHTFFKKEKERERENTHYWLDSSHLLPEFSERQRWQRIVRAPHGEKRFCENSAEIPKWKGAEVA